MIKCCACVCVWVPSYPSCCLGCLPLPLPPLGAFLSLCLPWVPPSGLCYLACFPLPLAGLGYLACLPLACAGLHASLWLVCACLLPSASCWLVCLAPPPAGLRASLWLALRCLPPSSTRVLPASHTLTYFFFSCLSCSPSLRFLLPSRLEWSLMGSL